MTTVLISGVGALGGWALEFLARTPGVERIVTVKRSPWQGPSRTTIAMLGSAIAGHTKRFEHHRVDLADEGAMARLLAEVRPDAIVHSATVQSPRILNSAALDPARRAEVRAATFGMWLPWQLWPAAQLMRAVEAAGIDTHVVNASFPDVVNVAIWKRFVTARPRGRAIWRSARPASCVTSWPPRASRRRTSTSRSSARTLC